MKRIFSVLLVICMLSSVCVFADGKDYVQTTPYKEGFAAIKDINTGLYGMIDEDGNIVIECQYSNNLVVIEGMVMVKKNGLVGFVNTKGEEVIPIIYESAYGFMNGLTKAKKDGLWGYLDTEGNVVIPFEYEHAVSFYSDLAPVKKNGKYGFIDKNNNVVIDFQYDVVATYFQEGTETAVVSVGEDFFTVNKKGEVLFDLEATTAEKAIAEADKLNNPEKYEERENKINYPVKAMAQPTESRIIVNGTEQNFDAYNIIDYNFFKLRDLAYVLNGSQKQFEVTYDEQNDAINITTDAAYTPVGEEMQISKLEVPLLGVSYRVSRPAERNRSTIYINGVKVDLTGYTINDYNYFRLRDIASLLDFGVTWDEESGTVGIDASIPYTE